MRNDQRQEAGDHSTQVIATHVTIGIDEKRAREIYEEKYEIAKLQFSQEAREIANSRIREFENRLIDKMQKIDGAIESFRDPSLQLLLIEAQKSAAQSERIVDYELLSELLIHRHMNKSSRKIVAGINRAVEIVNEISDDALLALTVFHIFTMLDPTAGDIHTGLNVLEGIFSNIIYNDLPANIDWIEHLELLNAVRIIPFQPGFSPLHTIFRAKFNGYVCGGIEKNSDNHRLSIEILNNSSLPLNILVDHILHENYLRLDIFNEKAIENLMLRNHHTHQSSSLSDNQKAAIKQIFQMYSKEESVINKVTENFTVLWNNYKSLKTIYDWWPKVTIAFTITSVGTVLAHSNAQRCENTVPDLPKNG